MDTAIVFVYRGTILHCSITEIPRHQHRTCSFSGELSLVVMAERPDLVRKPGSKSCVWNYFGLEKGTSGEVTDTGHAVCRTCFRKVAAKNGNTTNLLSHLRSTHTKLYAEAKAAMESRRLQESQLPSTSSTLRPINQPTLTQSITRSQKYERKGKRWRDLTDAVVYYIAKDCLPLHSVEKAGFKRLLAAFDGRYEIPSRNYFSRTALPELYTEIREKIRSELASVTDFAATSDLWSSQGMIPYISYTIHFLNKDWQLQARCIQTKYLPEDHTGEMIAESMEETLSMWNLKSECQVCITTDSGSNIVNAARRLSWPRLSCFGHNLHLGVLKAIKDDSRCSRALGLCRKIVAAFSGSWKRKREFTKAQINLNLQQHSLISVSLIIMIVTIVLIVFFLYNIGLSNKMGNYWSNGATSSGAKGTHSPSLGCRSKNLSPCPHMARHRRSSVYQCSIRAFKESY